MFTKRKVYVILKQINCQLYLQYTSKISTNIYLLFRFKFSTKIIIFVPIIILKPDFLIRNFCFNSNTRDKNFKKKYYRKIGFNRVF